MLIGSLIGAIIGIVIGTFVNGILIWIVAKLRLGMEVDRLSAAFLAGFLVAVGGALAGVLWNLIGSTPDSGLSGAISHLIVATAVLRAAGNAIPGLRVKGWGGALVAALAIGAVAWLISLAVSALA